jgi:hypothetical protein
MDMRKLKGSDPVWVHRRTGTVHEDINGETPCGNGKGGKNPRIVPMTRAQANALPNSEPCESLACTAARR